AGAAAQPPQGGVRAVGTTLPPLVIARSASDEAMTKAKQNAPDFGGVLLFGKPDRGSVLLEEARELLLEARDAAAAIHDLLGAAGPGRVRLRIDVQIELVAFLAPGRAGLVLGAIGHHDRNRMIIRVNFGFHDMSLRRRRRSEVTLR